MNVITGISCSNCGRSRTAKSRRPCPNCGDTRRAFAAEINEEVTATATMSHRTKRGSTSWSYFMFVAALVVSIAVAVVAVLEIPGWAKAISIVCVSAILLTAFADSAWIHNWLVWLKGAYENKER